MAKSYENAGVNLEAGYEVVRRIKQHVASTSRIGTMGNIGAFGGMFDLSALGVKEPVLVSGTDGVGTKLKIAFAMDKHDTVGIDAVLFEILEDKSGDFVVHYTLLREHCRLDIVERSGHILEVEHHYARIIGSIDPFLVAVK